MTELREDPRRAVIIGAGRGGSASVEMLLEEDLVDIVGVVDTNADAPGILLAREHQIPVYDNAAEALENSAPCVAFNMTGNEMVEEVASGILGAGGIIGGMEARLIWRMVTNLKKAKEDLHVQATHDALTGLYNRHFGMEQLQQGISQAVRYRYPYSLVMLDIDHFKAVNDQYGHPAGDAVLNEISCVLRENLRDSDIPCRWGGEEFLILLPHTDMQGATQAAENWLQQVRKQPLQQSAVPDIEISFSAGVASLQADAEARDIEAEVERLLHEVDSTLYRAKEMGRSRVVTSQNRDVAGDSARI
ncbi:MAG: diguanylate cyclase [Mariprofundaceae bacterium]